MGENKHIKELDAFAKNYIKEIPQDGPSLNFTANIMGAVLKIEKSEVFKVKPLISKKVWFVLAAILASLFFIPFQSSEKSVFDKLPAVDFSFFDKIQFSNFFESFAISNTVFYAILFFGIMMAIQFTFLKKYFDEKFD